ncbi:nucleotide-binding protein [Burkholderia cenocepacia]|nr:MULTISPECIES: TIR domain-containing protein [Burkholderia]KAB0660055.1 cyclic nucleotide-binding domain-containing protein [Burkholderia diffusa]MBM2651098.1 nucleotide-binding protein [Burkholderia diffusa]MBR8327159.1 nucleotide-binding protein [Burkholderia cenocepacia]
MKERFEGEARRQNLIEALGMQGVCRDIPGLPERLADTCELVEFRDGERLIVQGDQSSDVYLLLTGGTKIVVGKKEVDRVDAGRHVGEMAAIEALPRSATVVADGTVVAAKLSESQFIELADQFPRIYKHIATELARRLERRNKALARADQKVNVFAISSVEALPVAETGVLAFEHEENIRFWNWPDNVFGVSSYPLEDLEQHLETADFAIAIAQDDDLTTSRKGRSPSPRDNVIFELGLFMGRLGRRRTILMKPKGVAIKLPSDLAGVTTIDYPAKLSDDAPNRDMAAAWKKVRAHIAKVNR